MYIYIYIYVCPVLCNFIWLSCRCVQFKTRHLTALFVMYSYAALYGVICDYQTLGETYWFLRPP
jgi:hypothetical protein